MKRIEVTFMVLLILLAITGVTFYGMALGILINEENMVNDVNNIAAKYYICCIICLVLFLILVFTIMPKRKKEVAANDRATARSNN